LVTIAFDFEVGGVRQLGGLKRSDVVAPAIEGDLCDEPIALLRDADHAQLVVP
jgi:hypothetical protein